MIQNNFTSTQANNETIVQCLQGLITIQADCMFQQLVLDAKTIKLSCQTPLQELGFKAPVHPQNYVIVSTISVFEKLISLIYLFCNVVFIYSLIKKALPLTLSPETLFKDQRTTFTPFHCGQAFSQNNYFQCTFTICFRLAEQVSHAVGIDGWSSE